MSDAIRVIAIAGKMSAGKTWSARYLATKYDGILLSIAQPLKASLVRCGFPEDVVFGQKSAQMRELMQVYGQAWRIIDPDHWVNKMLEAIFALSVAGYRFVIIDDLRFTNEAKRLQERWGAELFHIRRNDPPNLREQATEKLAIKCEADISEHDLENWDDWALTIDAASGDLVGIASQLDNYMNGGKGDVSEGDSTRQPRG